MTRQNVGYERTTSTGEKQYVMEPDGVKRLHIRVRLTESMGEPDVIECDGFEYKRERVANFVKTSPVYDSITYLGECSVCEYPLASTDLYCPDCGARIEAGE